MPESKADIDPTDTDFDPVLDGVAEPLAPRVSATPNSPPVPSRQSQATHQHTRGNVRRALTLGASRAEIDATDPDALEDWIDAETEARAREREKMARESAWREYETSQRKKVEPAPETVDEMEIDPETERLLDPGITKRLKRVKEQDKEIAELKKRLDSREENDTKRQAQETFDAVDAAIEELGRPELFGEGTIGELGKCDEARTRQALANAAGVQVGDSPTVAKRKIQSAYKLLYKNSKKAAVVDDDEETPTYGGASLAKVKPSQKNGKPRLTVEDIEEAETSPPTNRARKPIKSKRQAYKAVAEAMQSQRLSDEDFGFEEDSVPE